MEDVSQETQKKETQSEAEGKVEKKESSQKTIVDEAKEERERLEKVREELKAENDRLEALKASEMLGGTAEAGTIGKPKEPDAKDYANDLMAGNLHMNDFLDTSRNG